MKFIDEATIIVQSGNGGRGCVSFHRERFLPRGGPDGGDGGKGGDVILRTTSGKRTLYHLQFKKQYKAANGQPGQGSQKSGRQGADLAIDLPVGTLVRNAADDSILFDLTQADQQVTVARGGRGGKGNEHFKSATHRTPRMAQPGEPGQVLTLNLELKLMADVGIVGLPNAGKSTLISALTAARPKIADYPFTTLTPMLGVVYPPHGEPFVMADIPGLIEGAHQGAGMGIRFLRHVERTRILLHLIDASLIEEQIPLRPLQSIDQELVQYSGRLAEKTQIVVLNKMDIAGADLKADLFCEAMAAAADGRPVLRISAAARTGLDQLTRRLLQQLKMVE